MIGDKTVVVTGAGLIGKAVIKGLAEAGAKVIIAEINEQNGKKIELECKENKLDVIYKKMNITKEESIDSLFKYCIENFKKIDAWVNIAYPKTEDWGKKEQMLK